MTRGEGPRFDFEAVIPITVARAFGQVTQDCELAGLPLANDMEVLVKYQLGIAPEILRRASQQNASPPGCCTRAHVEARVQGMFDHAHMLDRLTEDFAESRSDVCRNGTAMAQQCAILSDNRLAGTSATAS